MDMGCLPLKVGFKRSALDVRETRGRGFPKWDLSGKIGRVTGAEHKDNKLALPETKTWPQREQNKVVIGGHLTL